jgi:protein involved in ribonucleotide reduction
MDGKCWENSARKTRKKNNFLRETNESLCGEVVKAGNRNFFHLSLVFTGSRGASVKRKRE